CLLTVERHWWFVHFPKPFSLTAKHEHVPKNSFDWSTLFPVAARRLVRKRHRRFGLADSNGFHPRVPPTDCPRFASRKLFSARQRSWRPPMAPTGSHSAVPSVDW